MSNSRNIQFINPIEKTLDDIILVVEKHLGDFTEKQLDRLAAATNFELWDREAIRDLNNEETDKNNR